MSSTAAAQRGVAETCIPSDLKNAELFFQYLRNLLPIRQLNVGLQMTRVRHSILPGCKILPSCLKVILEVYMHNYSLG